MSTARRTYLAIISIIIGITLLWGIKHFSHQSTPHSISKSILLDAQVLVANNLSEPLDSTLSLAIKKAHAVQLFDQVSFKVLPKATTENLNELCTWTSGRLLKLDQEIRASGAGSNSQYCEEYDLRRRELVNNQCHVDLTKDYQEFC